MFKKLSIITICYNEPNVEETCKSIVNQSWQDFEWVVIDGGSNKETLDIFEKYKHRIDKFVSEPDNGIYNACNKGINLSNGEFVIFMNAGDSFFSSDVLELVSNYLDNAEDDIYYGEVNLSYKNNPLKNQITSTPQNLSMDFFVCENICTQGVFIKRELYDKYGLFDESYKIVADYEKWVLYLKNDVKFKYLPIIIANYDSGGVSANPQNKKITSAERERVRQKYLTDEEVFRAREEYCKKYPTEYKPIEKIFSVKNSANKIYKIITILGIHIKIKRRRR